MTKPIVIGNAEWLVRLREEGPPTMAPIPVPWTKNGLPVQPKVKHKREKGRIKSLPLAQHQGKPCPYCATPMMIGMPHRPTREHVHPRHMGGLLTEGNRLIVCAPCNGDKGGMTLAEFANKLERNADRRAPLVLALAGIIKRPAVTPDGWLDSWTAVRSVARPKMPPAPEPKQRPPHGDVSYTPDGFPIVPRCR